MDKVRLDRMSELCLRLRHRYASASDDWDELWSMFSERRNAWHRTWRIPGMTNDDLDQEAMVTVWKRAIPGWDPKRSNFHTFSVLLVDRRYSSLLRRATLSQSGLVNACPVHLTDEIADTLPEPDVYDVDDALHALHRRVRALEQTLCGHELRCLRMRSAGHSFKEIASLLRCSTKSVDNAMLRIRMKVKQRSTT